MGRKPKSDFLCSPSSKRVTKNDTGEFIDYGDLKTDDDRLQFLKGEKDRCEADLKNIEAKRSSTDKETVHAFCDAQEESLYRKLRLIDDEIEKYAGRGMYSVTLKDRDLVCSVCKTHYSIKIKNPLVGYYLQGDHKKLGVIVDDKQTKVWDEDAGKFLYKKLPIRYLRGECCKDKVIK